jgi:hypothetical protein
MDVSKRSTKGFYITVDFATAASQNVNESYIGFINKEQLMSTSLFWDAAVAKSTVM